MKFLTMAAALLAAATMLAGCVDSEGYDGRYSRYQSYSTERRHIHDDDQRRERRYSQDDERRYSQDDERRYERRDQRRRPYRRDEEEVIQGMSIENPQGY